MSDTEKYIAILKQGGVGIIPTDTIYGIVASALNRFAVERAYKVRKRNPKKPFIILISSIRDLSWFRVSFSSKDKQVLQKLWPGKVTVILSAPSQTLRYLHRGTKTLAFRLPAKKTLRTLLKKTGPLIAPSANPEGEDPALTISQAKKYFGKKVDFYIDGGRIVSKPSTLIRLNKGKISVLRQGAVTMKV